MKICFAIIILSTLLLAAVAVLIKDSDDCRELAFQKSPAYGVSARRYFEVTDLTNFSPFSLSYLISFKCNPLLEVTTSAFSCDIKNTYVFSEQEKSPLIALIKGCEHLGK